MKMNTKQCVLRVEGFPDSLLSFREEGDKLIFEIMDGQLKSYLEAESKMKLELGKIFFCTRDAVA